MSAGQPGQLQYQFRCRRCGSVLEARVEQAGQRGRCPSCDADFLVPRLDPSTGLAEDDARPEDDGELPAPVHAYAAAGHKAPRFVRMPDDTLRIECTRCGLQSAVNADRCAGCGVPFVVEAASFRPPTAGRSARVVAYLGLASLLLSACPLVGLCMGGIVIILAVHQIYAGTLSSRIVPALVGLLTALLAVVLSLLLLQRLIL